MCSGVAECGNRLSVIRNRFSFLPITVHRLPITVCGLLITLFLTSCASVQPVVKIGLVAPFEGAQRELGYDAIYAARLAVREINAAGGIGGYRVALVALDDGGDVQLAEETAASLTIDPGVMAVVGHGLAETTAVAQPTYADANLPLLPLGTPPFSPRKTQRFAPHRIPNRLQQRNPLRRDGWAVCGRHLRRHAAHFPSNGSSRSRNLTQSAAIP